MESIPDSAYKYLENEIERLENKITQCQLKIKEFSNRRAELLRILETHKALDEYRMLNERLVNLRQQWKDTLSRIDNLKRFETGLSKLKIEREELIQKTRQDKEERRTVIEKAIKLFNQNSKYNFLFLTICS